VGAAEIGWMYGQYKRIANEHTGILTGKGTEFGGSLGRTEATGYGVVYLLRHVLGSIDAQVEGKRIAVSGSGNVALHAAEKLLHEGAVVLTLSERGGYLYAADGFTQEALALIKNTKARKQSLRAIAAEVKAEYVTNGSLWAAVPADVYLPAATQNEIDVADARAIIAHNPLVVIEGANMPVAREAVELVQSTDILFVPGKAANAGGVAVSGLEMSQNAGHQTWTTAKVDQYLELIMKDIFHTMQHHGTQPDGRIDYLRGANIGGFIKLFAAMKGLGW
jgi:glutamate dehydrogenase (NADP+)